MQTLGSATNTSISTADIGTSTFALSDDDAHLCVVDLNGRVTLFKCDGDFVSYSNEESYGGLVNNKITRNLKCKISFGRVGGVTTFAVPSKVGVTELIFKGDDGKWGTISALEGENAEATHFGKDLNLTSFSPNGQFLATSDVEGVVVVWKLVCANGKPDSAEALRQFSGPKKEPLVDLLWTSDNSLLVSSETGFGVLRDVIPAVTPAVEEQVELAGKAPEEHIPTPEAEVEHQAGEEMEVATLSDEAAIKPVEEAEKPKGRRLEKNSKAANDDSDGDDGLFEDTEAPVRAAKPTSKDADSQQETQEEVNMESISDIKSRVVLDEDEQRAMRVGTDADIASEWQSGGLDLMDMQERLKGLEDAKKDSFKTIQQPFQPSSTANDGKNRRFLVWNSVGFIRLDEDSMNEQNRIEVNFSDRGGRNKGFSFGDKMGFRIASLSDEGAFFATDIEEVEEDNANYQDAGGSKLFYHSFPGHLNGANESFYADLMDNEKALCVAMGMGWAAVATSKGLLRIFSSTGVQMHLFWLKGPVVTMVGAGSQLAVFYNAGQPVDGTSRINVEMYSLYFDQPDQNRCLLSDQSVPISKKGSLVWAGFEREHKTLVVADSEGMVSMLVKPMGWQWMPVYDIHAHRKSPDVAYWPIMVSGHNFTFIMLNGESQPAIWPKPAETTRELRLPVALSGKGKDFKSADDQAHNFLYTQALAGHTEKNKNECYVTGERNHDEVDEEAMEAVQMQADKMVLVMLQTALKAGQNPKAKDLCHKLRTDKGLAAGIALGNKFGRAEVSQLLESIQDIRMEQEKEQHVTEQPEPEPVYETSAYEEQERRYQESSSTPEGQPQQADVGMEQDGSYYTNTYDEGGNGDDFGYSNGVAEEMGPSNNQENESSQQRSQVTPSTDNAAAPFNPFGKNATPVKRKAEFGLEGVVKDMKTSPSPVKKPLLSRQSSFSESARKSQKSRQALL